MSTTTESKAHQRFFELRKLTIGEGITLMTELSPEFQELFHLNTGDPDTFIENVDFLRKHTMDKDALEAASYALGIDGPTKPTLQDRHYALLQERFDGDNWDVSDIGLLEIEEIRGLNIIASSYDLAVKLKELATQVDDLADTSRLDHSTRCAFKRAANKALLRG